MKLFLLLLPLGWLFAAAPEMIYQQSDALKPFVSEGNVYLTGFKNRGLYILESGGKKTLLDQRHTIKQFSTKAGKSVVKTKKQQYSLSGKSITPIALKKMVKVSSDEQLFLLKDRVWLRITDGKDRYYGAKISGDYILYAGLNTGLHLYNRKTEQTVKLGKGGHATFSTDGTKVVFAHLLDDGVQYTSGKIYQYTLKTGKKEVLFDNGKPNCYPVLDGNTLYFQNNYNIYRYSVK